jgi:putative YphP/YqiW family bacilliredoxin
MEARQRVQGETRADAEELSRKIMPYPEMLIAPMRGELAALGARELKTRAAVDEQLKGPGTVLLVVNSVCGCAAGKARPGVAMALTHRNRPDVLATVFAGADIEATARAREHLAPYPPSSPSMGLFHDGTLVWMMERSQIEGQDAHGIAQRLIEAFDRHCAPERVQ